MKHAALPLFHLKIRVVGRDWQRARYHLTGQKSFQFLFGTTEEEHPLRRRFYWPANTDRTPVPGDM